MLCRVSGFLSLPHLLQRWYCRDNFLQWKKLGSLSLNHGHLKGDIHCLTSTSCAEAFLETLNFQKAA